MNIRLSPVTNDAVRLAVHNASQSSHVVDIRAVAEEVRVKVIDENVALEDIIEKTFRVVTSLGLAVAFEDAGTA